MSHAVGFAIVAVIVLLVVVHLPGCVGEPRGVADPPGGHRGV